MTAMRPTKISPSLMCADLLHVEDELRTFEECDVDLLHVDVMDGHYAPNYGLGVDFCDACHEASSIPLDIHLMIDRPTDHASLFCYDDAIVTFHPEVCKHPVRTIDTIRECNARPGIAIDPAHPIETYRHLLPLVDQVCIMTVNPGFAGQELLPFCLTKIQELREFANKNDLDIDIEVDGNVSWENIPKMIAAGANVLVAGSSSIFCRDDGRAEMIDRLQTLAAESAISEDGRLGVEKADATSGSG